MDRQRIYLAPPNIGISEKEAVSKLLDSGWVAPAGPILSAFESKLQERFGFQNVLAVNSGTSALHLAVKLAGIRSGDHVLIGSLTFVAAANAVLYEGGVPVFIDSEQETWNLSPELLEGFLSKSKTRKFKALILTHIYGRPARVTEILEVCERHQVTLIEDAAEAVGSTYHTRFLGSFGAFGVLSFNGNKIITTGGGGALICKERSDHERALYLSEQAKEPAGYYSHREVGYNYRLSGPLAAIGDAQLNRLDEFLEKKASIRKKYADSLHDLLDFPEALAGENHWLTVGLVPKEATYFPQSLIDALGREDIEARRVWKPLHLQPLFKHSEFIGNGVSEDLFNRGICLPSGTGMTEADQTQVIETIKKTILK